MIKIFSKTLNENIYFVNNNEKYNKIDDGFLIYKKDELRALIAFHPTEEQLRLIHETKKIFNGEVK